jgi:uncharacterized protein
MRKLDAQQIRDIARGSAILGTGGGGDPYLGTLAALRALEECGPPSVLDPEELDDDALVGVPAIIGAPVPMIEKFAFGPEFEHVIRVFEGAIGSRIAAVLCPEMGGVNSVIQLALASRLGIPVVDADGMGRAYPEVDLITLTLYGIGASPFALADEHGNEVVVTGVNNRWVERLARATAVEFGAICAGMGYPLTGAQVREAAVLRTLTYAETIGRRLREAHERKTDAIDELVEVTNGFVLFRGKIADIERRTMRGWSVGEAVMEGMGDFAGSKMTVSFQNENLVAVRNDQVVASVPDLITIIDSDSGEAITTERLRYGFRVVVLGMPCDEKWRTPSGVALGGPRRFRYDFDYVPIERLAEGELVTTGPAGTTPWWANAV